MAIHLAGATWIKVRRFGRTGSVAAIVAVARGSGVREPAR